jgi:hypothetical protein
VSSHRLSTEEFKALVEAIHAEGERELKRTAALHKRLKSRGESAAELHDIAGGELGLFF